MPNKVTIQGQVLGAKTGANPVISLPSNRQQQQIPGMPTMASAPTTPHRFTIEFDGLTATLRFDGQEKTHAWDVKKYGFADLLADYENVSFTNISESHQYQRLVTSDGELYLTGEQAEHTVKVTAHGLTGASNSERTNIRNNLAGSQAPENLFEDMAAFLCRAAPSVETKIIGLFTQLFTEQQAGGRLPWSASSTMTVDGKHLQLTLNHLLTDDRDQLRAPYPQTSQVSLPSILGETTTAENFTARQLVEIQRLTQDLVTPQNDERHNKASYMGSRATTQTEICAQIQRELLLGILENYALDPLRQEAEKALGKAAQAIDLKTLANAVIANPSRLEARTQKVIDSTKTLRAIIADFQKAKDAKSIEQLEVLQTRLTNIYRDLHPEADAEGFADAPDDNFEELHELDKLIHGMQNQIHLDVANIITEDETTKDIAEKLKPVLEKHQQFANSALRNNNAKNIATLAAATQTDTQPLVELYKLNQQYKNLDARIDALAKDPNFKKDAEDLKKQLKDATTNIETAIKDKNLDAARELLNPIVDAVEKAEQINRVNETINTLLQQFNNAMRTWLKAHPNAPTPLKNQWMTLAKALANNIESARENSAQGSTIREEIKANLNAAIEKIPGIESKIRLGRPTVATAWQTLLTRSVEAFESTSLNALASGELLKNNNLNIIKTALEDEHGILTEALPEYLGNLDQYSRNLATSQGNAASLARIEQNINTLARETDPANDSLARTILQTVTGSHGIVADNTNRSEILNHNFARLPDINTNDAPGDDELAKIYTAMRNERIPEAARKAYSKYRGDINLFLGNIDTHTNNKRFNDLARKLTRMCLIARAAMLMQQVDHYYSSGELKTSDLQHLKQIAEHATKDDSDIQHLKHNLDVLEGVVTTKCMADADAPAKTAKEKLNKLVKMLDLLGVKQPEQRTTLQNEIFGVNNVDDNNRFFDNDGNRVNEALIATQAKNPRNPLWGENAKFHDRLDRAIEFVKNWNDRELDKLHNWKKYQQLLHLVNLLNLSDDHKTAIETQANEGLAATHNFLLAEIPYNQMAQLNSTALDKALIAVNYEYLARQKHNRETSKKNIATLKYFGNHSTALQKDLERITRGALSITEASELDKIIEQNQAHLSKITEALGLIQKEKDTAQLYLYTDSSIEDQQRRIRTLTALQQELMDKQQAIEISLNKLIANKNKLKTQGKPMLALDSTFDGGVRITTGERAELKTIDPEKMHTSTFPTLTGRHMAVPKIGRPNDTSFTLTKNKNDSLSICVPHTDLLTNPASNKKISVGNTRTPEQMAEAAVDVTRRGLGVLENKNDKSLTIQSTSISHLYTMYYTLVNVGGKDPAQITARYIGSATTLEKLTKDWTLEELEVAFTKYQAALAPHSVRAKGQKAKIKWAKKSIADLKEEITKQDNALKELIPATTNMDDQFANLNIVDEAQHRLQVVGQTPIRAGGP